MASRTLEPPLAGRGSVGGVCMMSSSWRDEQHPSFINFISTFLTANSFRLNFVAISPDFIFNCGGSSMAFVFITNWDSTDPSLFFTRIQKLKMQFARLYVIIVLVNREQNDYFVRSYFKYGMVLGKPTFVPVLDLEMGFEKILKIAHSHGECKRQEVISKLNAERKQAVQSMEFFLKVFTSIPGIDSHDANSLNQAIGSVEAIAIASKEYIIENTDLSAHKAEHLNARCLNLSPKRDMDSTTSSNEVSTNSIAMGSTSSSSGASRLLLFDRRYGWVIDEWRDPSEEALAGGRGMFCIVPFTKYLLKMTSQSISFAASSTMNVIERPDMLSPHVLQTCLNNQLGKLKSFPKHFLSKENISSLDGNRP